MDVHQLALLARQPSATLSERPTFWGMPKRGLALILANALFWQPLLVQAEGIVVSSPNTSLGQAGNGVPVVNIAAPNGAGLSHNQFQQYNVDSRGVILNNATTQTQSTQLGGIIVGNGNLKGRAASTILNEVNGANASQLNGYTEVAGQSARVIVANPYGISCNGCGFINTPQVTLTTGKPVLDGNGQLSRFNVQGGSVSIDGAGLNAGNVDQFDIITRSAKINAELHANKLNIITGRNDVDANTLNPTALADDGSAKPELAIDSSALGGMYAGAVKLVGTEAGVGVKLAGNLAASGGDIQIDANGKLTMAQTAASGAIIAGAGDIEVNGPAYAGSSASLTSAGNLTVRKDLAARDSISLSSSGQLTNSAVIEAGVNADKTRNTAGDVTLTAGSLGNTGSITASRNLQATVTQTLANQSGTLSGQSGTRINAGTLDNRQNGRVLSQNGGINITASQVLNANAGLISSSGNLTLNADTLDNSQQGKLSSNGILSAQIAGQLLNQLGLINAASGLVINAGTLDNRSAEISSLGTLTAGVGRFDNSDQGRVLANGSLVMTADTLDNRNAGTVSGQQGVQLNLGQLTNTGSGRVYGKTSLGLDVTGAINNDHGVVRGDGTLGVRAASLANTSGSITSAGTASVRTTGAAFNLGGELLSDADLTLESSKLDNSSDGRIAGQGVTVTTGAFDNQQGGRLTSTGTLNLTAGQVNNSEAGRIASAMALTAVVTGLNQTNDGRLYGNGDVSLDLSYGALNNQGGLISAPGQLLLKNLASVNNQSGRISSANDFTLAASSLDNTDGSVISDKALTVKVDQMLTNVRGLISANGLQLNAAKLINHNAEVSSLSALTATVGQFDNSDKGRLLANGALLLTADSLDNRNTGTVSGQQGVQLNLGQLTNTGSGRVYGKTGLGLDVAGAVNNDQGVVRSDGTLTLRAGSLANTAGSVTSAGTASVNTTGAVVNQRGELLTNADLTLESAALDNSNSGRIAGTGVTVTTGDFDNQRDGRLTSMGALNLTAAQVNNSEAGRIASAMALTAVVTGLNQSNDGRLYGNGDVSLDLSHGVLNNQRGLISAPGQLLLNNLAAVNNQNGEISSANGFTLAAASLDNTDGSLISDKALVVTVDRLLTNLRGLISANGIDLKAGELNNRGGSISSDADLLVSSTDALSNQMGELSSAGTTTLTAMSLGNLDGQIMADRFLEMVVTGSVDNQKGTLGAGLGLDLKAASLDNRAGTVVTDGDANLVLTGALDNRAKGAVQAKGRVDITSLSLNNQGGSLRAQTGMQLRVNSLDNSQIGLTSADKGLISSNAGLELIGQQLDNRGGLLNSAGPLQLTTGSVLNDKGRIASQSGLTASVDSLSQQGGELVATGDLALTGKTLVNQSGGLVGSNQAVKLTVDDVDNRGGEISSQSGLGISGSTLDNSDGGKVLAGTALGLAVAKVINRNKGLLFGDTAIVTGASLDNTGGSLAAQKDLNIDLSDALENGAGLLSSEGTLTVKADALSNVNGSLSSAGALQVATAAALNNQQGSITTDAGLVIASGSLDNSNGGALSGKGATRVDTGLFNNSQNGRLTSSDTLQLNAGQVINQNAGRIASGMALTASVSGLDQQGGELFSNTALSLDLHNGQLNNQGGLINAPGTLLLKNLKGVDNQYGEISSEQSFELTADTLDNSGGKLLSNQMLTLVVDQALRNLKGTIFAAALSSTSESLDNNEGLISSHGALELTVDKALSNVQGTVIADGELKLNAASVNNGKGQIASKQNLIARVVSFEQLAGELVAQGALTLTGDTLVNGENGLVGATQGINLIVSDIDNRGSEISSQGAITLTGQHLNNSDGGRVLAQQGLTLDMADIVNRAGMLSSSKAGLTLTGASLDNAGGTLSALQSVGIDLSGVLNNSKGLISSESLLTVKAASLTNSAGSVSSADDLTLNIIGGLNNDGGALVTDGALDLHSASLTNRQNGSISGKALLTLTTGDFDNSQKGRVSGGDRLELKAAKLTNRDGSIGSTQALVANVTALDQEGGRLFSNTALSLDLNGGELNNRGGLINAPGTLLLKNLASVLNQNGEISSAEAFTLSAAQLENSAGKLLSNHGLTVRVAQALNNVKGVIAAAGVDLNADSLNNSGGTVISRNDLKLTVAGQLNNRDQGLINSAGTLQLTAAGLDAGNGGEVSALGDMTLTLNALALDAGRLIGDTALSVNLNNGDLSNQAGLITAKGPLTLSRLRDLYNQSGEISSDQSFLLAGRTLNNSGGKIISSNLLTLQADSLNNQTGLLSGWQGVTVSGNRLDNRNTGTVSSRYGNVGVDLSGALLNSNAGALVSQRALTVAANSLDNTNGILSSGTGQTLTVTGLLNNSENGLIDSGAGLIAKADALDNSAGNITAQQEVSLDARTLNNSAGSLSSKGTMTLDLLGQLINTQGKLASGGELLLRRSTQISNQGGQLVSQTLMTLNTDALDNSNRGTLAANGQLVIAASGHLDNSADGLIYSQNADLQIKAASLGNARGAVQSQAGATLEVTGDIDNQNGRIIAQNGDLNLTAASLDSRGGVLSSQQGGFSASLAGTLSNGLNTAGQGGVIQAERLNLSALAGLENNGGRISARSGEALLTTANFSNRNGGLYGKGLLRVIAQDFDNGAGGQVAAGQIDLRLNGALSNQTGIVESDTSLAVTASRIDNQNGRLRALGTSGKTDFQIGSLFDNRNGALDVASNDLTFNAANFLNGGGSLLHTGNGTFDISTANLTNAGGSVVTQGGLTLSADSWTNSSVIQAGRLTVNVGTLNQTASGQLLAATAFTGLGGNWTNDGLIASGGSLDINIGGFYSGVGRTSSAGQLGLNAAQVDLNAATAITAGSRGKVTSVGSLTNFGRLTSMGDLEVTASSLNNQGTLGAADNLRIDAPSLINQYGLIFSGGSMVLRVSDFTNRFADVYSLGSLGISRTDDNSWSSSIENVSATIESGGDLTLAADKVVNRKDVFEAVGGLVSGAIGVQCNNCASPSREEQMSSRAVWIEKYSSSVVKDSASSSIIAGHNLTGVGRDFKNNASVVSAGGDITLNIQQFTNQGALTGDYTLRRTFDAPRDLRTWRSFMDYNAANDPSYLGQYSYVAGDLRRPNIHFWNSAGDESLISAGHSGSGGERARWIKIGTVWFSTNEAFYTFTDPTYDSGIRVEAPSAARNATFLENVIVTDNSSSSTNAVVQAGGKVSISASQTLLNSVVREGITIGTGSSRVGVTELSGNAAPKIVSLNAQLPPDLAQQQVNSLTLPGFSLPTGQNGLFRLSSRTSSSAQAGGTPSQGWIIGGAAISLAQREQHAPEAHAGVIEIGPAVQVSTATRQLGLTPRQIASIGANASIIDVTNGPAIGGIAVPGHQSDGASFVGADAVTGMTTSYQGAGSLPPTQNGGATNVLPVTGVSSNPLALTPGNVPSTSVVNPAIQVVNKVEALPSTAAISKPQKYLIETNPVLTELKQFMSSDYLLSKLGYDPDQSAKRLGDGLYEQRLVQQAVVARTGQAFLTGQTSNEDQFRYLMNNAITSKNELDLAVGVSLSPQQVAALTHDIVWLEEHEVNGEKVLVPVLYLAQANNRLGPTGALIAGTDVTLIAGENLENVGTIRATNNLSAVAGNNLVNSGLLEAGNRLDLLAGNDIINKSGGIIAGRDVNLVAINGDVVNERSVSSAVYADGRAIGRTDYADTAARIEAANDMSISAGRDVSVAGGVVQSGRDTSIDAGRDVNLLSAQAVNSDRYSNKITQLAAEVASGRDLTIKAARDVNAIASQISAKRDIAASAGENLTVSSAADEYHYLSRTKKVTVQKDNIRQVATTMEAGGNIALNAGQDLAVIASRINATGDIALDAAQNMTISSAKDESSYFYAKKSKGSFGRSSSKQQESYDSKNVASEIAAGGSLIVNATKATDGSVSINGGRDVSIIGSKLTAGKDLVVAATNDIAMLSGVEEHGAYSKKTKSGFGGFSKSGRSELKTAASQVATELKAGTDVLVASGKDVRLRASEIEAGNDVELRAGLVNGKGDINLVSADDQAYSHSERYKKKTGLSVSGGFVSVSSAKEAGREAQSSSSVGSQVNAVRDAALKAERDINVIGSSINAGRNVSLNAGQDVNINAAQSSRSTADWEQNRQTGIGVSFDANGVTIFSGVDRTREKNRLEQETAAASKISAGENLAVTARRDINQVGSDLEAANDIDLTAGRNIKVSSASETRRQEQIRENERNGLSATINHNFGRTKDALSGAGKGEDTVSKASSTLKAVDSVSQFMAGPTGDGKLGKSKQSTAREVIERSTRASTLLAGNDINLSANNDVMVSGSQLQAGRDINVAGRDVTFDAAKNNVTQETRERQSWGGIHGGTSGGFKLGIGGSNGTASGDSSQESSAASVLRSGRDVNLVGHNDLNLIGTQVEAVRNIDLNAANDLNIKAAQNVSSTKNTRKNGGGEVGLTFGFEGVGVYASVNIGKGNLDRKAEQQQEAYLYAGDRLGFSSGQDTSVTGANLRGDQIVGRVGGDLNASSPPDTGKVKGSEFDLSATVAIGPAPSISGSVGYGRTNGSTNWVEQQTRITGKNAVDIRTENHTQLDGALIASDNGNLKLDTGSLSFSDIAGSDKEHGYYLNVGGTYGQKPVLDASQTGKGGKDENGWSVEGWNYEKDRQQIVRATVGAGEVVVRNDVATGVDSTSGLNRDVGKAYEITKDGEHRTDLYVSKSSLEAVSHPVATVKQWANQLMNYDEQTLKNFQQATRDFNGVVNGIEKALGREMAPQAAALVGTEFAESTLESLIRGGMGRKQAMNAMADPQFQEAVLREIASLADADLDQIKAATEALSEPLAGMSSSALLLDPTYVDASDEGRLSAAQHILRSMARINSYVTDHPDEQDAIAVAISLAQGPKGVVQLAVSNALSETPLGQVFGEKLSEVTHEMGKRLAESIEARILDEQSVEGYRLIGGGGFMLGVLGGIAGRSGSGKGSSPRSITATASGDKAVLGGAHRDTSKPVNDGLDSHHCPAKNCYASAPISTLDGPAIKMDPADHQKTASYGSSPEAKAYRAKQQELLQQGRLQEAIDMDVRDIRAKFGDKYDSAIKQMQEYAHSLDPGQFMNKAL
jgi:filamentous hemagglutinin